MCVGLQIVIHGYLSVFSARDNRGVILALQGTSMGVTIVASVLHNLATENISGQLISNSDVVNIASR